MILNRPAIDWLTLTTYDTKKQADMAQLFNRVRPRWAEEAVNSKMLQYDGRRGEQWFIGAGQQKGRDHFIFRFSGDLADAVTWQRLRPSVDCTRIDLQLTLPLPVPIANSYQEYKSLVDTMHESEIERGQRARGLDAVISPDGFCTLYVGSRESERFYRFYVKEAAGLYFLRFEVEYKGSNSFAGRVWRDTAREPESIVTYIKGELSTLPDHPLTRPFHESLAGSPADIMKRERRVADPQKTLEWLRRQVSPAMKRLIGNEDTRDAAIIILMDWLQFAAGTGELISE